MHELEAADVQEPELASTTTAEVLLNEIVTAEFREMVVAVPSADKATRASESR